jgi:hypothetical protein
MKEALTQIVLAYRGEILAALSIVLAIVVYIKSRRFKSAFYFVETNHIIGSAPRRFRGLEVLYNGSNIESFSASKIFLWNRGTEAIRGTDIAPAAPLLVNQRDGEVILDHKVLYCSSPHSKVSSHSQENGGVLIAFDYLDPKNGLILEVLHTGGPGTISVSGSIIGGGEVRHRRNPRGIRELVSIPIFVVCLLSLWLGLVAIFGEGSIWASLGTSVAAMLAIICIPVYAPVMLWGSPIEKLSLGYAKQANAASQPAGGD